MTSSLEVEKIFRIQESSEAPTPVRFVIKNESPEARREAIAAFESEARESGPEPAGTDVQDSLLAIHIRNADVLIGHNELDLARALLRQVLNQAPRHVQAMEKLFMTLVVGPNNKSERKRLAEELETLQSSSASAVRVGRIYIEDEAWSSALEWYFKASERITEESQLVFDIYKEIGNLFVRLQDFDGAEEYYHKAFALSPDSDALQVNLGTLAVQRSNWPEARDRFRAALTLNPTNDRAWVGVALAHYNLDEVDLAFANLMNALEMAPGNRTGVHLLAAWSQRHQRQAAAIEALENYLAFTGFDEDMSIALIELYCEMKEYKFAMLELERVLCWNPERTDLYELEAQLRSEVQG